ncbi:iron-sulfur cluster repair di-iron protein [Petroclostridium sp. X23]|jgi:regulator of cell morphogenesis and NO signaling|uniref:iron-sulfur cluster repair di-iron protein n=1 Tax=Petroclostridium sp. X23 TaxID=3045146 RepID=UPI0024ACC50E|nr:iron-sulfur cluster repair di-iron protein [Petroclostridium sp. X23]WHH57787.1 iron-sulfur cluster repair di-iron protein [Petroclostridium sp. X23]
MSTFNISQSIGEIVSIMPKASDVFKKYNIDFCCGGHRPLSEAIREHKLNDQEILRKLDEAYEETTKFTNQVDFRKMAPSELIDYIVNTHHVFVKKILPEISELTTKILRVHGPSHSDLFKVHKLFHNLKTELEQHLIKEEEILFPMIKEYDASPSKDLLNRIDTVIKETEDEHETAGGVLKELRKVTQEYKVPEDGCGTYCKTFEKLQELESDLFQHIHLENNILFKQLGLEINHIKM